MRTFFERRAASISQRQPAAAICRESTQPPHYTQNLGEGSRKLSTNAGSPRTHGLRARNLFTTRSISA